MIRVAVVKINEHSATSQSVSRDDQILSEGIKQGWGAGAGAGRSRVFLAPWSRSRLKKKPGAGATLKKSQEPEPLKN